YHQYIRYYHCQYRHWVFYWDLSISALTNQDDYNPLLCRLWQPQPLSVLPYPASYTPTYQLHPYLCPWSLASLSYHRNAIPYSTPNLSPLSHILTHILPRFNYIHIYVLGG